MSSTGGRMSLLVGSEVSIASSCCAGVMKPCSTMRWSTSARRLPAASRFDSGS